MKTISYKSGNVMKLIVATLIILASLTGIAKAENSNLEANPIVGYNAKNFVEAELAVETANWMKGNGVTNNKEAEPVLALQVAAYNAKDYVESELALEAECWINNDANCNQSEKGTNYNNELANN